MEDKMFSVESWNHPGFDKYYHMVWGPFPLDRWKEIDRTIISNFHPQVQYIKYRHQEVK